MWKTVKLGDVCKIVNGSTPLRKEKKFWVDGNVSWFTIDDMREQGRDIFFTKQHVTQAAVNEKKVKLIPANSVLLCCTASIGEVAIARKEMATNQQFNSLTPTIAELCCDYLYYVATTLKSKLLQSSGTTTISFLSMTKLKEIEIPLPPLAEQQRIVAKLDAAFVEIDKAVSVVEAKVTEVQKLKTSLLSSSLNSADLMWKTVKLGDVATVIAGQSPKGEHYNKEARGTPFYQGKKDYGETYLNEPTVWTDVVTKLAEKDDILMSVRAPVGALNIATQKICIGRGLAAIRPSTEILHDYLFYSLLLISHQLEGSAGAIFNSINKAQIEAIQIPLPPLAEQQRIVAKLDAANTEFRKANESIAKSKANLLALKSALLKKELQPSEAA